jgi:X-X-X-Leu-X-X-Gly heptad repeat protein
MRSRPVLVVLLALGVVLLGTGAAFAYTDTPPVTVTEAEAQAPEGLSTARQNLNRASLPLTMLDGGVGQLTDGTRQLDDGARQLADGLGQAHEGGRQLADGLGQLQGGVTQLGDGAAQVSGGVDEVVGRLVGLAGLQTSATDGLVDVANTLRLSPDPASQAAAGRITELVATLDRDGLGPETLAQLELLRDGARQLAYELTEPNAEFVAGMATASDGSRQLRDGLALLDDGGRQLTDGTGQLVAGVDPVADVVGSVASNVREATGALPQADSIRAGEPTLVTGERQMWPFALLGLGAIVLVGAAVTTAVQSRPTR